MGGSQSVESDDELFVPVIEQWKHNKRTIRAPHQLEIHKKKGDCIYCRIVKRKLQKSKYYCIKCKFYFCFSTNVNHFKTWHSEYCDHFQAETLKRLYSK